MAREKKDEELTPVYIMVAFFIVAGILLIVAIYLCYQMMGQMEQKAQDKWDAAWIHAQQYCKEYSNNNTCDYYGCLAEIYPTNEGQMYLRMTEQNCLLREGMK